MNKQITFVILSITLLIISMNFISATQDTKCYWPTSDHVEAAKWAIDNSNELMFWRPNKLIESRALCYNTRWYITYARDATDIAGHRNSTTNPDGYIVAHEGDKIGSWTVINGIWTMNNGQFEKILTTTLIANDSKYAIPPVPIAFNGNPQFWGSNWDFDNVNTLTYDETQYLNNNSFNSFDLPAGTYRLVINSGAFSRWMMDVINTSEWNGSNRGGGYNITWEDSAAVVYNNAGHTLIDRFGQRNFFRTAVEAENTGMGNSLIINHSGGKIYIVIDDFPITDNRGNITIDVHKLVTCQNNSGVKTCGNTRIGGAATFYGISFTPISNTVDQSSRNVYSVKAKNIEQTTKTITVQKYSCRCQNHLGNPLESPTVCQDYWPERVYSSGDVWRQSICQLVNETITLAPNQEKTIEISVSQYKNMLCGSYQTDLAIVNVDGVNVFQPVTASVVDLCNDCSEITIACSNNTQCGTNGFVGNNFCSEDDVKRDYVTFTCNNPGTANSYCSNSTSTKLVQSCSYGCTNGICDKKTRNGGGNPISFYDFGNTSCNDCEFDNALDVIVTNGARYNNSAITIIPYESTGSNSVSDMVKTIGWQWDMWTILLVILGVLAIIVFIIIVFLLG